MRGTRSKNKTGRNIYRQVLLASPLSNGSIPASQSGESNRAGLFLDRLLFRVNGVCWSARSSMLIVRSARFGWLSSLFSFDISEFIPFLLFTALEDFSFTGGDRGEGRLSFTEANGVEDVDTVFDTSVIDDRNEGDGKDDCEEEFLD